MFMKRQALGTVYIALDRGERETTGKLTNPARSTSTNWDPLSTIVGDGGYDGVAWRGWFVVAIVAAVVVIVVVVSVVLLVVLFVVAVVVGVAAVLVVAAVVPFRCGRCPVRPLISCVPCFLCCLWILLVCAIRASCVMCGLLAPCAFGADLLFFCVCLSCFSRLSRVSCDTRRLPMWGSNTSNV